MYLKIKMYVFWKSPLYTGSRVLVSSLTTPTGQVAVTFRCVVGLLSSLWCYEYPGGRMSVIYLVC